MNRSDIAAIGETVIFGLMKHDQDSNRAVSPVLNPIDEQFGHISYVRHVDFDFRNFGGIVEESFPRPKEHTEQNKTTSSGFEPTPSYARRPVAAFSGVKFALLRCVCWLYARELHSGITLPTYVRFKSFVTLLLLPAPRMDALETRTSSYILQATATKGPPSPPIFLPSSERRKREKSCESTLEQKLLISRPQSKLTKSGFYSPTFRGVQERE
jgi:hypothetical protein